MSVRVGPVDLEAGRRWFAAAKEGRDLVSPAERNGAVATITALMDVLADPETVLPRAVPGGASLGSVALGDLNVPMVPYRGEDPLLRGRDVPLLGAIDAPSWWRSGAAAPSSLPAWVRSTDSERRSLWGACAWVLERLAGEGERNPQQGSGRSATSGNPFLIGVVALAGLGAWAYVARGAVGDVIREVGTTHRFAEQAATTVKLYLERLSAARSTGVMPPASPAEVALNPAASANAPAPQGSPRQVGESWWSKYGDDALKVGAGAAVAAGLAGFGAWIFGRLRARLPQAPTAPQSKTFAGPMAPQQPRGPMPRAMGGA